MKRAVILILSFLLFLPLAWAASNPYLQNSLQIQLDLNGKLHLLSEGSPAEVSKVSADLSLFPQDDYRQKVQEINQKYGTTKSDRIIYEWKDPALGEKQFGYSALVNTINERVKVQFKVPFPLNTNNYNSYTLPSKMIDSNHPEIVAQAAELAEGEDDAFKVAFKLASWVEENVKYNLNTLNTKSAQKASIVLEKKEGVCEGMTSLFIAMCRSLGIPARFVSGISYSNSPLFNEPWQPHGWAEVYFPEIGWVSFDIAFGEYGYIDVTHLKLKESLDPSDPATEYQWLGNQVKLSADNLNFEVKILKEGLEEEEALQLEQELSSQEVGIGSYVLIKGILKNDADYYAATTLQLGVPSEIEITQRNKRTILLAPKEVKETYWIIKVPEDLDSRYLYTFPMVIYSEKNVSVKNELKVQKDAPLYLYNDIQKLIFVPEEKTYSRRITLSCNVPKEIRLNQSKEANCSIKNIGNTNLQKVQFCIGGVCSYLDLLVNQEKVASVRLKSAQIGWNKLLVSAENELIDKKMSFDYSVQDTPKMEVTVQVPHTALFGENFYLNLTLNHTSFSSPQKVELVLSGRGMEQHFEMEELKESQKLEVELRGDRLSSNNHYQLNTTWQDAQGVSYSELQEISVRSEGRTFSDKVKMFLNGILGILG